MTTTKNMTVGDVAGRAGVNVQTVHYYERRGLIPTPGRNDSNYRVYQPDTVSRIHFVQRAQELGFSLKDIRDLLALRAAPRSRCDQVRRRAEAKLGDIDQKIKTLRAMRKALSKVVGECSGSGPITDCPILEALDRESDR